MVRARSPVLVRLAGWLLSCAALRCVAFVQMLTAKLSALNPSFFPWPAADMALAPTTQHLLPKPPGSPEHTVMGQSGLRVVLSPAAALGVDDTARSEMCKNIAASLDTAELSDWLKKADGVGAAVAAVATAANDASSSTDTNGAGGSGTNGGDDDADGAAAGGTSATTTTTTGTAVCRALADASGRDTGELLFLGTGSASPSKYRNVSAIMLSLPRGRIMLDCGEGTYGQLVRRFGVTATASLLRSLRCIFVTHMHADHHLGIIELLVNRKAAFTFEREQAQQSGSVRFGAAASWPWWPWSSAAPPPGASATQTSSPSTQEGSGGDEGELAPLSVAQTTFLAENEEEDILIVAPSQLGQWIRRYHATVQPILPERGTATFGPNAALTPDAWRRWHPSANRRNGGGAGGDGGPAGFEGKAAREARQKADDYTDRALGVTIRCCDVDHPAFSSGAIITNNTSGSSSGGGGDGPLIPWKLVYSGDTRPCEQLHKAGQGATILIHEATMENDLDEMAMQKRHSTTAEAVGDGVALRAERTILTHFSQRYPKLSPWMDMAATLAAKKAREEEAAAEAAAAGAGAEASSDPSGEAAGVAVAATALPTPKAMAPPPGVNIPASTGTSMSMSISRSTSSDVGDGQDALPRLRSGSEERKLQDYYEQQTGIAFDLMTVNFADLMHMPGTSDALARLLRGWLRKYSYCPHHLLYARFHLQCAATVFLLLGSLYCVLDVMVVVVAVMVVCGCDAYSVEACNSCVLRHRGASTCRRRFRGGRHCSCSRRCCRRGSRL